MTVCTHMTSIKEALFLIFLFDLLMIFSFKLISYVLINKIKSYLKYFVMEFSLSKYFAAVANPILFSLLLKLELAFGE